MDGLQEYSSPGDEQQNWPLTPELIGRIVGVEPVALDSEMIRDITRTLKVLRSRRYTGCLVLVFEDGKVRSDGLKVDNVTIGPAEKAG